MTPRPLPSLQFGPGGELKACARIPRRITADAGWSPFLLSVIAYCALITDRFPSWKSAEFAIDDDAGDEEEREVDPIMKIRRSPFTIALLLVPLFATTSSLAQQPDAKSEKLFLGLGWTRCDLGGKFDDSTLLSTSSEIINVPEVVAGSGLNFALGLAWKNAGYSFYYGRSNPRAVSVLGDSKSRLRFYGMDGYVLPFASKRSTPVVSPLLRGSMSLVTLSIDNMATDGYTLADASFHGIDGALGIGVLIPVRKPGGVLGQVIVEIDQRWMMFTTVQGTGDRIDIQDGLTSSTTFFMVSFSVFLK